MNINKSQSQKRVLIAPLDWGLGHATRCIPLIRALCLAHFEVFISSDGPQAELLKEEFPGLQFISLPGYGITYSKNAGRFALKMASQIPVIISAIKSERKAVAAIVKKYSIDIIISDNRYGCRDKGAHSVFITHQLAIKTGKTITDKLINNRNYAYINKFDECWVPDTEDENNLAGELSHPPGMPSIAVKYIGPLSRFKSANLEKNIDLLIVLSGPEPQRTILENTLIEQLKLFTGKAVLVRGLPSSHKNEPMMPGAEVYNHLPAADLNRLYNVSEIIVARSGYSTIMDLAACNKPAILVPTPGQTEQEYLAEYLSGRNLCITTAQHDFNLLTMISRFKTANFSSFAVSESRSLNAAVTALK